MAKTNQAKESNIVVAPADVVVETVVIDQEVAQVTEEIKAPTKAEKAQPIFTEESAVGDDKLRARVIKRFKDELGMGDAGASTYFQNAKKKAAGEKVKHYYKPKSDKPVVDKSDDSVPESFEVKLLDGSIQCFLSQQEADNFIESNPSIVDPDQAVEAELEA